jgi:hypothetical protein
MLERKSTSESSSSSSEEDDTETNMLVDTTLTGADTASTAEQEESELEEIAEHEHLNVQRRREFHDQYRSKEIHRRKELGVERLNH